MNQPYLKEIRHECFLGEEVCEWDYVPVGGRNVRIYYKLKVTGEKQGFYFYAIYNVGRIVNEESTKDEWHKEYCHAECVINGIAYFDGIRHLHYGDEKTDNFGYHFCPNLKMISETLLTLRGLEEKYCSDFD